MKVMYIARKFPPCIGGMERVAKDLHDQLSSLVDIDLIKPRFNSRNPLSVPLLFIKSITRLFSNKPDVIYLQDAMLSPLVLVGRIFSVPVIIQVHGLDVTYSRFGYQSIIIPFLRMADKVISVSESTKDVCKERKVDPNKVVVIPNGIDIPQLDAISQNFIEDGSSILLPSGKFILSVGRLIERKGYHWFLEHVMPKVWDVHPDVSYVIVGDGSMKDRLSEIIISNNWKNKVVLLGRVDNDILMTAYRNAIMFISPNIPISNDKEGFGISNIEATYFGLPVIASRVDGIPDAIIEGVTGYLMTPSDSAAFSSMVNEILDGKIVLDQAKMRDALVSTYSWSNIAQSYAMEFTSTIAKINRDGENRS